jgi:hypothetical protein
MCASSFGVEEFFVSIFTFFFLVCLSISSNHQRGLLTYWVVLTAGTETLLAFFIQGS